MTRIIGIDYGMARIGMAISDEAQIIARPLTTIVTEKNSKDTAIKVAQEIKQHNPKEVVIGLPYHMNGRLGCQADEVNHFISLLTEELSIPIISWDERLTTVQAERSMREANMSRKKRAKVIDSISAVIILQNYLDSKGQSLLK